MYRIVYGINDINKETLFQMADQELGLRGHGYKILKQFARLDLRKNSFSMRVVNAWNELPVFTACAKTMNEFKSGVDAVKN